MDSILIDIYAMKDSHQLHLNKFMMIVFLYVLMKKLPFISITMDGCGIAVFD